MDLIAERPRFVETYNVVMPPARTVQLFYSETGKLVASVIVGKSTKSFFNSSSNNRISSSSGATTKVTIQKYRQVIAYGEAAFGSLSDEQLQLDALCTYNEKLAELGKAAANTSSSSQQTYSRMMRVFMCVL